MTTAIFVAVCGLVYYGWSSFKPSSKQATPTVQVDTAKVESVK